MYGKKQTVFNFKTIKTYQAQLNLNLQEFYSSFWRRYWLKLSHIVCRKSMSKEIIMLQRLPNRLIVISVILGIFALLFLTLKLSFTTAIAQETIPTDFSEYLQNLL
jgi:hypothetical protein